MLISLTGISDAFRHSMTFKKKVCLILGLSLVLVCGFESNLTENQTQNTFHIASDRFQT